MTAPDLTDTQEINVAYTLEHIDAEIDLQREVRAQARTRGDIIAADKATVQLDAWLDRRLLARSR